LQHPGLLDLWTGNFDIGYALARGNARSDTLVTGFGATRATRKDKISAYLSQIYSSARTNNVTSTIASSIRGGWKYNRNFDGSLFVTGFNDYEHDEFQSLDLRLAAGGGLGIRIVKKENAQLDADAGVNYQRENFNTNVHRNSAEANFGDNLAYNFSKTVSLTQAARMFINLSNTGEYRANFDLSTNTVLKRWLSFHITGSDRFVSNPLVGRQKNDLVLSTGLRITFAH
jgi:putative salt-induced outer membrane protein YdiY